MAPERESREKTVYFIRSGTQEELKDYLKKFCDPLLGSSVYVDRDKGNIYYISWPDLPKERVLPRKYVQISRTGPRADIYAPDTQYTEIKNMVIKQIKKNSGGVEAGIRAFDHILEGIRGKEDRQALVVQERAYEILDLFKGKNLTDITKEEFSRAERSTYSQLTKEKINPENLVNIQKRKMLKWLLKGESGRDETGRLNWLISVCALQAAHRTALERRYGLGPMVVKFIGGREALVLTRQFCRGIFEDISSRLSTRKIQGHILFKYPEKKVGGHQLEYVWGMLGTMEHQLESFIPVRPYKQVGEEVASILVEARYQLKQGGRPEAKKLMDEARRKLLAQLEESKYVYPVEKIY